MAYQTLSQSPATPLARLVAGSAARRAGVVLAGSWLLAASAWIEVPMYPVPMTMQTYAVLLVGALCGFRLGAETVAAYLVQGALGLPMFAGGAAGLAVLAGPTGGYLVGFLMATAFIGFLADRDWNRSAPKLAASLLVGHLLVFVPGLLQLASFVGADKAITFGWTPFIAGTVLKSALAFATVLGLGRFMQKDAA